MHVPIDSSTHYSAFQTVGLHCQTPTLAHCVPCREAVCTIFMMVFGMSRLGGELTTYRRRGGHANHLANPTRFIIMPYDQTSIYALEGETKIHAFFQVTDSCFYQTNTALYPVKSENSPTTADDR